MNDPFFKPWVGKKYEQGYMGAKVLVLGASHYCGYKNCEFFKECTRDEKGTRKHDKNCPDYEPDGYCLHDMPNIEVDKYISIPNGGGNYRAYNNFTRWLRQCKPGDPALTSDQKREIWEQLAFCNLFQYIVPGIEPGNPTPKIQIPDIKERIESIINMREIPDYPDVVVLWGSVLSENLFVFVHPSASKFGYNNYHVALCGRDTIVHVIDHPTASRFHSNNLLYLHQVIQETQGRLI